MRRRKAPPPRTIQMRPPHRDGLVLTEISLADRLAPKRKSGGAPKAGGGKSLKRHGSDSPASRGTSPLGCSPEARQTFQGPAPQVSFNRMPLWGSAREQYPFNIHSRDGGKVSLDCMDVSNYNLPVRCPLDHRHGDPHRGRLLRWPPGDGRQVSWLGLSGTTIHVRPHEQCFRCGECPLSTFPGHTPDA